MTGSGRWLSTALLAAVAFACPAVAHAEGKLEIRASLDRADVGIGQPAMLTFVVIAEQVDVPRVTLPEIPGAQIERLGTSEGFSWVNGRVIRTITVGFRLRGEAEGEIVIPAVRVSSGGLEAASTPLSLRVSKTPPVPRAAVRELFARLTVDRGRAYWNECIIARFAIYSRVRLDAPPVWDPPAAAGFWTEVLGPARTQRRTLDGAEYDVTEVRVAYFPTRTGRLTIGPARAHVRVVRRVTPPDPWSMLGLPETQVEEGVIDTERATVEVVPLPGGAPAGFKGAVGRYAIDIRVDRSAVRAGEPIAVVTTVRGEGNVGSAGDPDITPSVPARIYPAGVNTTLDRSGDRLRGERRREVTVIPETPGRFAILPVRYSWFDPEQGRYRTQVSDSIRVTVYPSDARLDSLRAPVVTGPIAALRSRPGARGDLTLQPPAASTAIALASIAAALAAFAVKGVRTRSERDPRRRRVAALDALLAELRRIQAGASGAAGETVAVRVGAIVRQAVGLRYGIETEGRPATEVLARAKDAGAVDADLAAISALLHAVDLAAFAPPASRAAGVPERDAAVRLLQKYRAEVA